MENRRGFLKAGLALAGISSIVPVKPVDAEAVPESRDRLDFNRLAYRGFTLYWTGWKSNENSDVLVGQWCAFKGGNEDEATRFFYASYPGAATDYFPGCLFDTSLHKHQEFPMISTPEKKMNEYRLDALLRVMSLVDSHILTATK